MLSLSAAASLVSAFVCLLLEDVVESASELDVFATEIIVDVVQAPGLVTRKREFGVVAGQLGL